MVMVHYKWEVERKSKGAGSQHLEVNICGKMDWRMIRDGEQFSNSPSDTTCPICIERTEEGRQAGKSIYSKSYMES